MKLKKIKKRTGPIGHNPHGGEIYLHKERNEAYVVSYAGEGEKAFALICVNNGMRWGGWKSELRDIFDGNDRDFELIPEGTELTFTV